jgi:formylglycine-generating enzyme required for sulfatase activity
VSGAQNQGFANLPGTRARCADQECDRFEAAWKAGQRPRIEVHLAAVPEAERFTLLQELILLEIDYRRLAGEHPESEEYLARFPALDRGWIVGVVSEAAPTPTRFAPNAAGGADASRPLGKFLLLQPIGAGGCGTVWRALDTELDRVVALKIPDAGVMKSPMLRARFRREARAAARLSHPNVVTLFGVDQVGDTPLLVMEYVEGIDLGRLVAQSGPLPVRQACDFVRQAALGLQHAHERGLVHRDVKPANLLLTERGAVVKVLDLGLALLPRRPEDSDSSLTEPGCVMGTADFMAPEQSRDSHNADARADIYSLGCTLYYLLTAEVPFPGGTFTEKMLRHHTDEPVPVEQLQPIVPAHLAAVARKMMARRPEDRHQTAADLVTALTEVLGGTIDTEPAGRGEFVPAPDEVTLVGGSAIAPQVWRRGWPAASFLAAAGLVLLVLWGLWNWLGRSGKPAAPGPPVVATGVGELEPFITNSINMKLVLIPPGRFLRGADESEPGSEEHERPRREITISQPFYLGVYEVTQAEFENVMGYNPSYFNKDRGGSPTHPVEMVTHPMAVSFCEQLSALPAERQARRSYHLPTEAQWEYACRADSRSTYSFGNDSAELTHYAWYANNAGGKSQPVGLKMPNAWGLYDMHGNVWEWCADSADPSYYGSSPDKDPICTKPAADKILRGGGWGEYGTPKWCRSATRGRSSPGSRQSYHGLRVALTISGGTQ